MATTPAKKAASGAKPTAAKPSAAKPSAAKSAPKSETKPGTGGATASRTRVSQPSGDTPAAPDPKVEKANVEVKLKDLVEKITAATGLKKQDVRAVAEALLKEMGDALAATQVLNLPGFGKARVAKMGETPQGTMTIKLRRGAGGDGAAKAEAEPLASPGEDS